MLTIIAKSKIKEGYKEEYLKLLEVLVRESRKEEDCIAYDVFVDGIDDHIITFIEKWRDRKAIDDHNKTEHFTTIIPKLMEIREYVDVNIYTEVKF